jgi:glycosyltransferase involved in cell wall biosynthesis
MIELPVKPALVSVAIPIFNHARFIRECLDSVAAETYPLIEVVAIDDGSTDASYEIASEWVQQNAGRFVRAEVRKQENIGLNQTLNRLARMARGEFFIPLASDDLLLPGGIMARVEALWANPQWLAVFSDCIVVDESGTVVHKSGLGDLYHADKTALSHPETIETELVWRWSVPGATLMMRRSALLIESQIGPYPEELTVEDRWFYLTALSKKALGFLDVPVGGYRLHRNQTITARSESASYGVAKADELCLTSSGHWRLHMWLLSNMISPKPRNFLGRVWNSLLWRTDRYFRRAILYLNSRKAARLFIGRPRGARPPLGILD